jgi:hypothetical protein
VPNPVAPFRGAIYKTTDGGAANKLVDLGLSCLYIGGGGNTATAPNANPDGPDTLFAVTGCTGNTLTVGGDAGTGATGANNNGWGGHLIGTDCSLGPYATKHCTRTNAACTTDTECGGTGLCNPDPRCVFGPPLPVPAAATSTCVLNVFRADASGSVDKAAGSSNVSLPLASYVYLTGNTDKFCRNGAPGTNTRGLCTSTADCTGAPGAVAGVCATETPCPTCEDFGTPGTFHCISGKNHGAACTPVGSKLTSLDCLPKPLEFLGPLGVDLAPLGTGPVALTAQQNPARNNGFFFCPVNGAGSCTYTTTAGSTCQRTAGCFGRTNCARIEESGSAAGSLVDNATHPVTISAVFCIPATGNALVDGGAGADLPGPGAVSITGTFQLLP